MSNFFVLIPSRLESSRLPEKPLKKIGNKTLIQRVYEQASKSDAEKVLVATDSEKINSHCLENNIDTILTGSDHRTGTDRLAEAVEILSLEDDQIIVNVQGDEPFIEPTDINNLYHLVEKKNLNMATLYSDLNYEDVQNQTTGQGKHENGEHDRHHEHHHFSLVVVHCGWRNLLLNKCYGPQGQR